MIKSIDWTKLVMPLWTLTKEKPSEKLSLELRMKLPKKLAYDFN